MTHPEDPAADPVARHVYALANLEDLVDQEDDPESNVSYVLNVLSVVFQSLPTELLIKYLDHSRFDLSDPVNKEAAINVISAYHIAGIFTVSDWEESEYINLDSRMAQSVLFDEDVLKFFENLMIDIVMLRAVLDSSLPNLGM